MNYTQNYQLNQWEETDRVLMDDFNQNNQKIESALGKKTEIVFGTYTGDGTETRDIYLGFAPRAVVLVNYYGVAGITPGGGAQPGGIAIRGGSCHEGLILTGSGFQVKYTQNYSTNRSDQVYSYMAFRN